MGKRGNGQSIKIWNTEKVTAIHMIPPCCIRLFPAAAPLQMCLILPSLSLPRPWRNWGRFRSYLKETRAGRMAVSGFCLLSSQSRCPVWHMVRSVLAMAVLPSLLSPCHRDCHPHRGKMDQILTIFIQLLFPVALKAADWINESLPLECCIIFSILSKFLA